MQISDNSSLWWHASHDKPVLVESDVKPIEIFLCKINCPQVPLGLCSTKGINMASVAVP